MHVNKIFFSFFTKLDIIFTTIRIISIGTAILVTIIGIEIVMFKKTSVFIQRTKENIYINTLFLKVEHA